MWIRKVQIFFLIERWTQPLSRSLMTLFEPAMHWFSYFHWFSFKTFGSTTGDCYIMYSGNWDPTPLKFYLFAQNVVRCSRFNDVCSVFVSSALSKSTNREWRVDTVLFAGWPASCARPRPWNPSCHLWHTGGRRVCRPRRRGTDAQGQ